MDSPHATRIDLAPEPASVPAARAFVTKTLTRLGLGELAERATLLTSELATNAVRHARTPFAVVVSPTADGAMVDVLDDAPEQARLIPDKPLADGGRGLHLVAGLSGRWGATPAAERAGFAKGVRFSLSREEAGMSSPSRGAASAGS